MYVCTTYEQNLQLHVMHARADPRLKGSCAHFLKAPIHEATFVVQQSCATKVASCVEHFSVQLLSRDKLLQAASFSYLAGTGTNPPNPENGRQIRRRCLWRNRGCRGYASAQAAKKSSRMDQGVDYASTQAWSLSPAGGGVASERRSKLQAFSAYGCGHVRRTVDHGWAIHYVSRHEHARGHITWGKACSHAPLPRNWSVSNDDGM